MPSKTKEQIIMEKIEQRDKRALYLANKKWGRYVGTAKEVFEHLNRGTSKTFTNRMKMDIAQSLENLEDFVCSERFKRGIGMFTEANEYNVTTDIASFIKYGFQVISALLPNLIAPEIINFQTIDRRSAEIYYMNILYGSTRGSVTADDSLFHYKTGPDIKYWYPSEQLQGEPCTNTLGTKGVAGSNSGALLQIPVRASSITVTDGTLVATDDGAGVMEGDVDPGGTINYTTGALSFNFNAITTASVTATYRTNFETAPDNIGTVVWDVGYELVEVEDFKLKAIWSFDSAYDLMKAHGKDSGQELLASMTATIRAAIDTLILESCYNGAGLSTTTFDCTAISNVPEIWQFQAIARKILEASNKILSGTQKATGNRIAAGVNICTILESLPDTMFKSALTSDRVPTGPHYIGTFLNKFKVYKVPAFTTAGSPNSDKAFINFKGDNWLEAGAVWANYLPLFITDPILFPDDMKYRRGIASKGKFKMINDKMFGKFAISNYS